MSTGCYYGFQLVWTDMLIFINTLRENAGFIATDRRCQANLYLLEYVTEQALLQYDGEGARDIVQLIGRGQGINGELAFIIYQTLHIEFVSQRGGKARFRKIPHLLRSYFSSWSREHNRLIQDLKASALANGCEIHELEFSNFPDIKW